MGEHLVIFVPSGKRGKFEEGTPILDAARELGVYVESVCGGRGICGRCQVAPQFGKFAKHGIESKNESLSEWSAKEQRYVEKRTMLLDGRRLSCSTTIQGPLVVDIPSDTVVNRQTIRKDAADKNIQKNPAIQMCYVVVEKPDMHKPLGDTDRLLEALERDWGFQNVAVPHDILLGVQKILRDGGGDGERDREWEVTAAIHHDNKQSQPTLVAVWPKLKNEAYGISCDIGSTTIALHLSSLLSGQTIAQAGTSNPQIRFGEDLMSRVSYVMMNQGHEEMTKAVRGAINELIKSVCEEAGVSQDDVLEAVFVGNPIMHHLFLGIDPTELGGAPFALAVSDAVHTDATDLGLDINKGAKAYILPCIAGHVGADAAAAILCEGPHRQSKNMLLVDVGTNAEIVLGNKTRLLAASSPTGPAFEGAEISCGQRAAPGAIERVRINPKTLEPNIRIIGVEEWSDDPKFFEHSKKTGVTGICGSGIIEVIAELYLVGVISEDGIIDGNVQSKRIIQNGRTFSYVLWEGEPNIVITQNDVRAIQLAKAALYAGTKLLMDKLGLNSVDKIALAGAFGTFINPMHALVLGLVPDCEIKNVRSVGNAAGTGARMALLNKQYRREIEKTVRQTEKIETALEPDFQQHFVNAMAFPNKTEPFQKLQKEVKLPDKKSNADTGNGGDSQTRRRRRTRARRNA